MITLFTCFLQIQNPSFAASFDIIDSKSNPAIVERTSDSSKKIRVRLPVEMVRRVCTDWESEPVTHYRPLFVPCGFWDSRGFWGACYVGDYPHTTYRNSCRNKEQKITTEIREVILKFKNDTQLSNKEIELFSVKANQKNLNSNLLNMSVEPTHTSKEYSIRSTGRRAVISLKK